MGLVREFVSALRTVFGPAQVDVRDSASGAINALLVPGPAELYGFVSIFGTNLVTARFSYVDATAVGTATPAKLSWVAATNAPVFARPVKFDKGLVLTFTSTGTSANWTIQSQYSPLPTPFGGAG